MTIKIKVSEGTLAFTPGASVEIPTGTGSLTIESAEDKISFMSDFDITRDEKGLALAQALAIVLAGAIQALKQDQAAGQLPAVMSFEKPTIKPNPLA